LGLFGPRREGIEGGVAFLRTAEMRDGKEGVCPVGPTHTLVGALVESRVPRIHADARPAAGDGLDLIVPPVPREVETFTNLGTEELVGHLGATLTGHHCWIDGGVGLLRAADVRDVKVHVEPERSALPRPTALPVAALPHVDTGRVTAAPNPLDLVVPPAGREVVAQVQFREHLPGARLRLRPARRRGVLVPRQVEGIRGGALLVILRAADMGHVKVRGDPRRCAGPLVAPRLVPVLPHVHAHGPAAPRDLVDIIVPPGHRCGEVVATPDEGVEQLVLVVTVVGEHSAHVLGDHAYRLDQDRVRNSKRLHLCFFCCAGCARYSCAHQPRCFAGFCIGCLLRFGNFCCMLDLPFF